MTQDNATRDRRDNLDLLTERVTTRSTADRQFRRTVGTLTDDLAVIRRALNSDPQSWRKNRAFHTVHVPSFIAVMAMLDEIDQLKNVPDDEIQQILASVHRAAGLARDARQRIEQEVLTNAKIELEILADYAPPPATPYAKPSLFTRTLDRVALASGTVWDGAKSTAAAAPGMVGAVQAGISGTVTRAASLPKLAGNLQRTLGGTLSDTVAKPVTMRLTASRAALTNGVGTGVGLGVLAGVLCPPLLPLSAGGAVLAAVGTWRAEMERARQLNDAEREQRLAQLKAERTAALRQLTQGADALQMETDELSLTLDVETGEADAVILSGDYAGQTWSSLSAAEKANLTLCLGDGATKLIAILAKLALS